jgi:UDP-N-acetylmuramoyl-tripeptide--D-alanyl-D-alanine ligase
MQIEELYQIFLKYPNIQTDTRKIGKDEIYFALKGEHFNGNTFAVKALELGAAYCVVDEDMGIADSRLILVEDVLKTLQSLAKFHRSTFNIPFIAITGSNGKTTTKELVHAVLSTTFKTYTTYGNLNNHIGIPLTLLSVKSDAEMAVIEMGANHQKEIEGYCLYAMPTHGLITNCGKAHLEGFGGEEGVKKGKGELYDYLKNNNGTAFVFSDYDYLMEMSLGMKENVFYGTSSADNHNNFVYGSCVNNDRTLLSIDCNTKSETLHIETNLVGSYNLPNILAAICIGKYFGVDAIQIKKGIEDYVPSNSRSQMVQKDSNSIILDAYNANPSSMKLAIENFASMPGERKILILGGMMELGDETAFEHAQLVNQIKKYTWKKVVLVGKQFETFAADQDIIYKEDSAAARIWFDESGITNAQILLKGSRSMKMEKVLE